jgi:hypothetical protein
MYMGAEHSEFSATPLTTFGGASSTRIRIVVVRRFLVGERCPGTKDAGGAGC